MVLRSDLREVSRPLTWALENEVIPMPVSMPIMAITTSSSIKVNPLRFCMGIRLILQQIYPKNHGCFCVYETVPAAHI